MKRFIGALMVTGLCAGCLGGGMKVVPLSDSVRGFHEGLRWQRFKVAASFIAPGALKDSFLETREEVAEDVKVTDTVVMSLQIGPKGQRAFVKVRYTWHFDRIGVVEKTVVLQRWVKPKKLWLLKDEEIVSGEKLWPVLKPAAKPSPKFDEFGQLPEKTPKRRLREGITHWLSNGYLARMPLSAAIGVFRKGA